MNIQIIASGTEDKKVINILIASSLPLSVYQIKKSLDKWLDTLDEQTTEEVKSE